MCGLFTHFTMKIFQLRGSFFSDFALKLSIMQCSTNVLLILNALRYMLDQIK